CEFNSLPASEAAGVGAGILWVPDQRYPILAGFTGQLALCLHMNVFSTKICLSTHGLFQEGRPRYSPNGSVAEGHQPRSATGTSPTEEAQLLKARTRTSGRPHGTGEVTDVDLGPQRDKTPRVQDIRGVKTPLPVWPGTQSFRLEMPLPHPFPACFFRRPAEALRRALAHLRPGATGLGLEASAFVWVQLRGTEGRGVFLLRLPSRPSSRGDGSPDRARAGRPGTCSTATTEPSVWWCQDQAVCWKGHPGHLPPTKRSIVTAYTRSHSRWEF
ncbi:hypothetical protein H1C71_012426, partial [Ictidomys tridecemlineatus]